VDAPDRGVKVGALLENKVRFARATCETTIMETKVKATGKNGLNVKAFIHYILGFGFIIRPPGTMSSGRAYVLPMMFLFLFRHAFSELPRPIALKLCHMVGIWLKFIMPLENSGGALLKKFGAKTCKISVHFGPLQT